MRFVDTHCHLQHHRFDDDREDVIARALEALEWLVVIGDDIESSAAAVALSRDRVYAAVGVHPYHAEAVDDAALERLRSLAAAPGVVALGEIGLDYFNEYAPRPAQRKAFAAQLALASELGLPVVIHNRESDADTHALLAEHMPALSGCIMHCFGSGPEFAEQCVALGCHISFAGNAAFPKAEPLRDAARATPLERLLVETDAPYLAPPPLRGKRCEPQYVQHTGAALAAALELAPENLAAHTTANARALFRVTG